MKKFSNLLVSPKLEVAKPEYELIRIFAALALLAKRPRFPAVVPEGLYPPCHFPLLVL